jgi:hypothetical protein
MKGDDNKSIERIEAKIKKKMVYSEEKKANIA